MFSTCMVCIYPYMNMQILVLYMFYDFFHLAVGHKNIFMLLNIDMHQPSNISVPCLSVDAPYVFWSVKWLSVQFSCSVVSDSLRPHESQQARPPRPSPTPGVHSNSCPLSQWCHPAISSSVVPFSSCPQSRPASGSFPMSQMAVVDLK